MPAIEAFIEDWVESRSKAGAFITPGVLRTQIQKRFKKYFKKEQLKPYLERLGLEQAGGYWKIADQPASKRRKTSEGQSPTVKGEEAEMDGEDDLPAEGAETVVQYPWTEIDGEDGVYFFNEVTGESQWEFPQ